MSIEAGKVVVAKMETTTKDYLGVAERKEVKMNNEQIDKTSYYKLPCGKFLEDFIHWKNLNFAEGSALKYAWRAGHKDGETKEKDMAKALHYCRYLAERGCVDIESVMQEVTVWHDQAAAWDGIER